MKFSEDKAIELEFDERKALLDGIKHDEEEHNPGNIVALEPDVVEVDFELEEIEKQEAVRSKEEEKRQLEASDEFRKKHGLTSGGSRVQVQQTIDSFSGFKYLEMNDFIVEDEDMKEVLDRETNSGEAILRSILPPMPFRLTWMISPVPLHPMMKTWSLPAHRYLTQ